MKSVNSHDQRKVFGGASCKGKSFGCTFTGSWFKVKVHQVFCSLYWATKF